MLYNSEDGSAKTNLCARNAPLLLDINFLGVKDEFEGMDGGLGTRSFGFESHEGLG